MKLFTCPAAEDAHRLKARQRVSRLPTVEILNWADQAGSGVAKALEDFRRQGTAESSEDARTGLQALLGVVEELQARA